MATTTRERMIATTARLLQHRGYHGTSLNDILTESGAPRGSLYFHFPGGKDELVMEATRATVTETTGFLRQTLDQSKTPAAAVRRFFEEAARLLSESDFSFGCPVAPVILDGAGDVAGLEKLCRQAFEEWTGLFRGAFIQAGIPRKRAEALALLVESSLEGLLLISRAYRDSRPVRTVAKELEAAIRAATPAPGSATIRSGRRTTKVP